MSDFMKVLENFMKKAYGVEFKDVTPCAFDNVKPDEATGVYCSCPKCSPRGS